MRVARKSVGRYIEFHGSAPFGVGSLRGVYLDARVSVGFASGAAQIHCGAIGRKRRGAFVDLGVEFAFDRFGALPFALFVF